MTDRSLIKSFLAACFKGVTSSATQSLPIREQWYSIDNETDAIGRFPYFIICRDLNLPMHIKFRAKHTDRKIFKDILILIIK